MEKRTQSTFGSVNFWLNIFIISTTLSVISCKKHDIPKALKDFTQVNLVANNNEYGAQHMEPSLINAWGIAFSPGGIPWVNAQAGHVSFIFDKDGNTLRPAVNIPSPASATGGNPSGIVFNSSTAFLLKNGNPAAFLFVGVDGVLSGWNQGSGANAELIKNNAATAVYTGLAIGTSGGKNYLYAANFKTRKIDVWNGTFIHVTMSFTDPSLPAGYAPFNIQNIDGKLYVMYAKVGSDGEEEVGIGNGFVSIFNTDGSFVKRFASGGKLNAPWGVAYAHASFFGDDMNSRVSVADVKSGGHTEVQDAILVGNFGDGRINAYDTDGNFIGQLLQHGQPLTIEGLWAISFPPATATSVDPDRLYFAAGPDDETHGLFGYIIKQ